MTPRTRTPERYADEMGALWTRLNGTLRRLDAIAGDPELLDDDDAVDALRRLQYRLHLAGERVYGLEPPPAAATAHAELSDALEQAREATAEVADAVEAEGGDGVRPLLHMWRGALFRVRLARLRLAPPAPRRPEVVEEEQASVAAPLAAFLLALGGAVLFVAGATLALWPVWAVGLVAVCCSVLVYRP